MISYAQNGEDVVLWRLFGAFARPGFYVDVGAAHPVLHSVTKWFSLHGWRGVNVEPVPRLLEQLVADRPHDVNLGVACGAEAGVTTLAVATDAKWGQSSIETATSARLESAGLVTEH